MQFSPCVVYSARDGCLWNALTVLALPLERATLLSRLLVRVREPSEHAFIQNFAYIVDT